MNFSADSGLQNNTSFFMLWNQFEMVLTKNLIVVMLCVTINYINGTLVTIFFRHEIFKQNPRYILFIHLVLNDMIQLIIAALLHVISYALFKINVSFCCFLLLIAIFTTFNTPFNLAGMAFECYIAVCNPLRHSQICTVSRTYIFIGIIWAIGAISLLPDLFVLLATESNEFFMSAIYCSRDPVFHHTFMKQKRDIFNVICLSFVWICLVFTYFKILFAAKAMSTDARKARNTILLHAAQLLMCMSTYIGRPLENWLTYISPRNGHDLRFFIYLIIHILPRFLSPILYGLRDKSFRKYFKRYFLCNAKVACRCIQGNVLQCITPSRVTPSF